MTLRKKTLLFIGVTLGCLVLALYAVAASILLKGFARLEVQSARRDVERALNVFSYAIADLSRQTADYAWWDDTCAFAQKRNPDYLSSNFDDQNFADLSLNLVLIVNASRQIIFAKAFDLDRRKATPVPQDLRALISPPGILSHHARTTSQVSGIVLLRDDPVLISSQPILTSHKHGPVRGALIMGRYLNAAAINRLGKLTQSAIAFHRVDEVNGPVDLQQVRSRLLQDDSVVVHPLNAQKVAGYAAIRDVTGKPCLLLRVELPRSIYAQGQTSVKYLLFSLTALGAVLVGTALVLLEKLVLSPLSILSSNVNRIGSTSDLTQRVPVRGKDELASLSVDINRMLAALERSHREQTESEQRYRAVAELASDGIALVDCDTKHLVDANAAFKSLLGYTADELGELTLGDMIGDDPASVERAVQNALNGNDCAIREQTYHCKNGFVGVADVSVCLLPFGGRNTMCLILHDVTYRKRVEESLREAHAELEKKVAERTVELQAANTLLESRNEASIDGILVVNSEGQMISFNRRLVEMWGIPEEVVTSRSDADAIEAMLLKLVRPDKFLERIKYLYEHRDETSRDELELNDGRTFDRFSAPVVSDGNVYYGRLWIFRDITDRKRMEQELEQSHEQMRNLASRLQSASEDERTRIARQVHDDLGLMLTVLKMDLAWLEKRLSESATDQPSAGLIEKIQSMSQLVDTVVESVQRISAELRPALLDHAGLAAAIEWHVEEFEKRTGIQCFRVLPEEVPLDQNQATAIFRILQEALTNVARHAKATVVEIDLECNEEVLTLTITDNGKGIGEEEVAKVKALGLLGMRERALLLGGTVRVEGPQGKGTTVTVQIPRGRTDHD